MAAMLRSAPITRNKDCGLFLDLAEKQKFALHYDFRDDWMFIINVQKIAPKAENKAPVWLKAKGSIEQYPVWDEEW